MREEITKLPMIVKFLLAILAGIGAPFGTYHAIDESGLRWWAEKSEHDSLAREFRRYAVSNDRKTMWLELKAKEVQLRDARRNLFRDRAQEDELNSKRLRAPRELRERIDFYRDEERRLKNEIDALKNKLGGG